MRTRKRMLPVIAALIVAQFACNLPTRSSSTPVETPLPAPNQTLTALFSLTTKIALTPSATLPPIFTATSAESGGGVVATATLVPTQPPAPTATKVVSAPTAIPTVAITPILQQPTATRRPPVVPTNTSAPVGRRTVFTANYLSSAPTIDGDWGEWKTLTKEYPANHITYGGGNWVNEDDLSSSFHVGWDEDNLYIAMKVRDDVYVQNASGENIYLGDSLEILLDTKLQDDFYYSQLSADDFQLGINPGRPTPGDTREAYLWFPSSVVGKRTNVSIGALRETGVYRVELAIPWNVFETTPSDGKRFGFMLSASDNDDGDDDVQQTMVSSSAGRRLTDPTTWGELRLVK